jgi:transposase
MIERRFCQATFGAERLYRHPAPFLFLDEISPILASRPPLTIRFCLHAHHYPHYCSFAPEVFLGCLRFGDESGLRSDYHAGTTWGVKGQTPVVPHTGNRFSLNMLSVVNARGQLRFMVHEGRLNGPVFVEFLKRLVYKAPRPIFLVLDGHSVHKSRPVRDYVTSQDGKLRLFFLPPYSPELNPDEQVWNHVKHHGVGRMFVNGKDQLRILIQAKLRRLQKSPWLVQSFFLLSDTLYAA